MKAKRNTIAARVRTLSPLSAWQVAKYGRTLDPIERATFEYLEAIEWRKLCIKKGEGTWAEFLSVVATRRWQSLQFELLGAIQHRDGEALRLAAKAVENFRFHLNGDEARRNILWLRDMYRHNNVKPTTADVSEALHWRGDRSTLRRLLREAKFPTRATPGGRPRKP